MSSEIADMEQQIMELTQRLARLRREVNGDEVPDYRFSTLAGDVRLLKAMEDGGKNLL